MPRTEGSPGALTPPPTAPSSAVARGAGSAPTASPTSPNRPVLLRDAGSVVRTSVDASRWVVAGAAKVTGNVVVDEADLAGSVSVGGSFGARRCASKGALSVAGAFDAAERVELDGASMFRSAFSAGELHASGEVRVDGSLTTSTLVGFSGSLRVEGDVTSPRVSGTGTLEVSGTIRSDEFDMTIGRDSHVGTIRARIVRVARRPRLPIPGRGRASLDADRIEATEAELEGVSVEYLRADSVSLGPDCHVARFEGRIVRRHPSAHVGPESRSPPPHGLSR